MTKEREVRVAKIYQPLELRIVDAIPEVESSTVFGKYLDSRNILSRDISDFGALGDSNEPGSLFGQYVRIKSDIDPYLMQKDIIVQTDIKGSICLVIGHTHGRVLLVFFDDHFLSEDENHMKNPVYLGWLLRSEVETINFKIPPEGTRCN